MQHAISVSEEALTADFWQQHISVSQFISNLYWFIPGLIIDTNIPSIFFMSQAGKKAWLWIIHRMVYEAQIPQRVSDIHLVSLSAGFHIQISELTDVYSHTQAESPFLILHLRRLMDTVYFNKMVVYLVLVKFIPNLHLLEC